MIVVTPVLPIGQNHVPLVHAFLDGLRREQTIAWYYTPLALRMGRQLQADLTVYDCMDELSAFKSAPPELKSAEAELFGLADIVFTGGRSLYESKRRRHRNIHCYPSSVDTAHFLKARAGLADPADQMSIPHPRLGFFGVIDERFDIELLARAAELRPDWSFVMIGPVVKIDPQTLPRRSNIHWLGGKQYADLPQYLASWDLGIMPFALNEATRFISPTKTPEFLATGLPIVSTPITDVVHPYGKLGLVQIAADPETFVGECETLLARPRKRWLKKVDAFLADMSWDRTWSGMQRHMQQGLMRKLNGSFVPTGAQSGALRQLVIDEAADATV